jgi:lactose/L-arabinose transport system permease protein
METTSGVDKAGLAYVPTRAARARTRVRRYGWPYVFIAPFFVLFGLFLVYPIIFSFWLSFREWPGLGPKTYVGGANYRFLLHDPIFWQTMRNSAVIFFIYVPVMTFLALVLASVLNAGYLRLQGFWRAVIFLPHITSMVAAGYTFRLILDTDSGFANRALGVFGVSPIPWLDSPGWARISIGLLMVWAWLGYNTLIMLAGLQTIPSDVLDAAKVDGANAVQVFRKITVPLLRPQIVFAVTLSIIGTFSMFTEPYILTRGGPVRATRTPVMEIFSNTFENLQLGYAAAMSYAYFAIIVVVTLVQFVLLSRGDTAPRRAF